MFVSCSDGKALLVAENWIGTVDGYDKSLTNYYWVNEVKESTLSVSILYFLFSLSGDTVYVGYGGEDTETCGRLADPCETIYQARLNLPDAVNILFVAGDASAETHSLTFSTIATYTVLPITTDSHYVDACKVVSKLREGPSLFILTAAASLSFTSLTFTLTTDEDKIITGSVFEAYVGTLTLTSVSIKPSTNDGSISLSKSLITLTQSATLTIDGCQFENITVSESGAVLNADLTSTQTISVTSSSLKQTTFTRCRSTSGNGGALYVSLGESAKLSIDSSDGTKTAFTDCIAPSGLGGGLYITTNGSSSELQVKHTTFSCDESVILTVWMECMDALSTSSALVLTLSSPAHAGQERSMDMMKHYSISTG